MLYNQGLNTEEINSISCSDYLKDLIIKLNSTNSKDELLNLIFKLFTIYGLNTPFIFSVYSDLTNSGYNILHLSSGGLGLPDRDYYFDDDENLILEKIIKII